MFETLRTCHKECRHLLTAIVGGSMGRRGNLCTLCHASASVCCCPLGQWKPLAKPGVRDLRVCQVTDKMHVLIGTANAVSFSSVQFSRSVVSDSLWPHESQHTRPPCPSSTPGVHSDSHSLSRWCHPAISSSVVRFSTCPQSLPASESFPMSQLFAWGGQSTGASALASFPPKKSQDWSPLEWTGWISLQSKGLSRVFSTTTVQKHQFINSSQSNSHIHTWPLEKS